jgi:hypothetical protein
MSTTFWLTASIVSCGCGLGCYITEMVASHRREKEYYEEEMVSLTQLMEEGRLNQPQYHHVISFPRTRNRYHSKSSISATSPKKACLHTQKIDPLEGTYVVINIADLK